MVIKYIVDYKYFFEIKNGVKLNEVEWTGVKVPWTIRQSGMQTSKPRQNCQSTVKNHINSGHLKAAVLMRPRIRGQTMEIHSQCNRHSNRRKSKRIHCQNINQIYFMFNSDEVYM